ncbi:MAG: efflux RND transporter permease subunit [Elusimicrobia bacterium]|nr:efflux RND transporter permease subunit [Elusimicrobiota bacterium]
MLFGIVEKNAILQVDYTNTLRESGVERDKAITGDEQDCACGHPLMTTIVLMAAMLPVAFGGGPGAANRATMAIIIVRRGTSLCLLITPCSSCPSSTLALFDDATRWVKEPAWGVPHGAAPAGIPFPVRERGAAHPRLAQAARLHGGPQVYGTSAMMGPVFDSHAWPGFNGMKLSALKRGRRAGSLTPWRTSMNPRKGREHAAHPHLLGPHASSYFKSRSEPGRAK